MGKDTMAETIYVNLEVLSLLREGQKLRVKRHRFWQLYNEESGVYRWVPEAVRRWWDASSRHSDLTTILDTYEVAMNTARHLEKDSHPSAPDSKRRLVELMGRSLNGLKMMQRTYADDATMVSRIGHLSDRVRECVERHGGVVTDQIELVVGVAETAAGTAGTAGTDPAVAAGKSKKKKRTG